MNSWLFQGGDRLYMSKSDVFVRQILLRHQSFLSKSLNLHAASTVGDFFIAKIYETDVF